MSKAAGFREVPIRELMAEFHDGPHATPKPAVAGPVFLGIKNITEDGRLDLSSIRHIDELDFPRWTRRVMPQADDIVFTYEATLHRYALIPEGFHGCLGRRLALIRPRRDVVDPTFLHLSLRGPDWRRTVEGGVVAGATVDRIPLVTFPDFLISIPELALQQRIASFLSTFDEHIDLNHRRIALLERLGRILFRQWFPGFSSPASAPTTKAKSNIATFASIADVAVDGVDPGRASAGERYVGLEHLPRRSTTLRGCGTAEDVKSRKLRFAEGDTLFGKIRPYFHKVAWAPFDGIASSDAIVFRAKGARPKPALVNAIASSDQMVAHAVATSNGTKMPRADATVLLGFPIRLPAAAVLDEFEEAAGRYLRLAAVLARQNRHLAATRDLLLPRLVSGQLDISDVDLGTLTPTQEAA